MSEAQIPTRMNLQFVNKTMAEQYECAICLSVMTDAADIGCKNQHLYCISCINKIPFHHGKRACPQCREQCDIVKTKSMPFINRTIKLLQVKCKNHEISPKLAMLMNTITNKNDDRISQRRCRALRSTSRSRSRSRGRNNANTNNSDNSNNIDAEQQECHQYTCTWIGSLDDYENGKHLCPLDVIKCDACFEEVMRKTLIKDHKELECQKCNQKFKKCVKSTGVHDMFDCPEAQDSCLFKYAGCTMKGKRKDVEKHERDQESREAHLNMAFYQNWKDSRKIRELESKLRRFEEK